MRRPARVRAVRSVPWVSDGGAAGQDGHEVGEPAHSTRWPGHLLELMEMV